MTVPTYIFRRRVLKFLLLACCYIILYINAVSYFLEEEDDDISAVSSLKTEPIYNVSKLLQDIKRHDIPWELIDMNNFDYFINQPACEDKIAALIAVHSAPKNFKLRLILRETWGRRALLNNTPLRLIFLLGAVANQSLQLQLEQENYKFGDMVQGNFMDHYKNMTYKHIMAFKWFIYYCGQAQILIKVDDDSFVNTPLLLKYLKDSVDPATGETTQNVPELSSISSNGIFAPSSQLFRHPQNLLLCKQIPWARVKRTYRSKWHVSKQEYAQPYYPSYCFGFSIIYSADVLLRLYKAVQPSKYFWIDDLYVTGILAPQTNITITSAKPFMLTLKRFKSWLGGITNLADKEFLFAWPDLLEPEIQCLWEMYLMQQENNITRSSRQSVSQICNYSASTKYISFFLVCSASIIKVILLYISLKLYFL